MNNYVRVTMTHDEYKSKMDVIREIATKVEESNIEFDNLNLILNMWFKDPKDAVYYRLIL